MTSNDPIIEEWMAYSNGSEADLIDLEPDTLDDPVVDKVNISLSLKQFMQELHPFRLSQKALQVMEEFLTFHLQVRDLRGTLPEANSAQFNLLIRCDEEKVALKFGAVLANALNIRERECYARRESDMLQTYESKSKSSSSRNDSMFPPGKKLILITQCQDAPLFDPDLPTGSAIDASRKKSENYTAAWKAVIDYVRNSPGMILLVQADYDVYSNSLRRNTELFYRACGHHVFIRPLSEDELLNDCLLKLRNSSFQFGRSFERNLTAYFHTVYPKAELRSVEFVDDLIQRIYTLYFSKQRKNRILTNDCIPLYNTHVASVEDVLAQMDALVGLETVKKEFQDIYTRQLAGLKGTTKPRYHMLFSGNPGTGKTTVAQMAADLFYRMNILRSNKLVVAKPSDLTSQWVGGSSNKTAEMIRRAYDGVLFIDEAYGLINNNHGKEVLNLLIQEMEKHSDRLIVILAGYRDEMRELLQVNPGLASRIGREILFEDYSLDQLVQIFHNQCRTEGFTLDSSAEPILSDCISGMMTREFFGNARDIHNLLQSLMEEWSAEVYQLRKDGQQSDLDYTFYPRHFAKVMPPKKEVSIHDLVGLAGLKEKLEIFRKQALYQRHLQEKGLSAFTDSSMHMIFTGNPGTGKTTVARLIADDLYAIGVLKSNRLVVVERKDLVSSIPGRTATLAENAVKQAAGGVLFVDEAYSLANGQLGYEVIEVFLTAMEEHKQDTVFIFAGYSHEMQAFLAMNPGIQSRIGYTFHFDNYTPDELTQMFREKLTKAGFALSDEAIGKAREIMEYFHTAENFGNGRFVNHVIQQTISQRSTRDFTQQYRDIDIQDIPSIKTLIATAPNSMQLYDPAKVTAEERHRTVIHELGHAIVLLETDPENLPESISIRNQAGSLGRVRLAGGKGSMTEEVLLDRIAILLAGKNAEKVFFGCHSTGCSGDYAHAKQIAQDMLEHFAMDSFGASQTEILKAADRKSMQIIEKHRDAIAECAQVLLKKEVLTGSELAALLKSKY